MMTAFLLCNVMVVKPQLKYLKSINMCARQNLRKEKRPIITWIRCPQCQEKYYEKTEYEDHLQAHKLQEEEEKQEGEIAL